MLHLPAIIILSVFLFFIPLNLSLSSQYFYPPQEVVAGKSTHQILRQALAAVVTVKSVRYVMGTKAENNILSDGAIMRAGRGTKYRQKTEGSGVLFSPGGYIFTNAHVVQGSQRLLVYLADHREFIAQIVGIDMLTDVAVIKINGEDFPYAKLGNSKDCGLGDRVFAIGNPLNLQSTVTAGIISAQAREIGILGDNFAVENFIQTDAAINPGNSGGALINVHGDVIGINTAIATDSGFDMGFGFAIPINLVKKIGSDLIRHGMVRRAYLGVALININDLEARALGLDEPAGVFVDDVFAGSPAEKAGVEPMDIVLAVDDLDVNRANALQAYVAQKTPGEKIRLKIVRNKMVRRVSIKLSDRKTTKKHKVKNVVQPRYINFGIKVEELDSYSRSQLGHEKVGGVLVTKIYKGSPADESGIQSEDIIISINRKPIAHKKDFIRAINVTAEPAFIVQVIRPDGTFHFFLRNHTIR